MHKIFKNKIKPVFCVGKSALIEEIHKPVLLKQGHFISGKFEQFQNDIPYQAIVQALEKFVNQLLMETTDQLWVWRQRILDAAKRAGYCRGNSLFKINYW